MKPKPTTPRSKIASGHNPAGLTVEQVGKGWRLLTIEEVESRKVNGAVLGEISMMWEGDWVTEINGWPVAGNGIHETYRTRKPAGYFLPKPESALHDALRVIVFRDWLRGQEAIPLKLRIKTCTNLGAVIRAINP